MFSVFADKGLDKPINLKINISGSAEIGKDYFIWLEYQEKIADKTQSKFIKIDKFQQEIVINNLYIAKSENRKKALDLTVQGKELQESIGKTIELNFSNASNDPRFNCNLSYNLTLVSP